MDNLRVVNGLLVTSKIGMYLVPIEGAEGLCWYMKHSSTNIGTLISADKFQRELVIAMFLYGNIKLDGGIRNMCFRVTEQTKGWSPTLTFKWVKQVLSRYVDLKIKVDKAYCDREVVFEMEVDLKPDPVPVEEVVEPIYNIFKELVDNAKFTKSGKSISGKPTFMHSRAELDQLCLIYDLYKGTKNINWRDVKGGCIYGVVPKGFKSDGKLRSVCVPSPQLNCLLTQEIGNLERVEGAIVGPYFSGKFRYSYDIKSCDYRIYPYFYRLVKEKWGHLADYIISPSVWMLNKGYLHKLPSGIPCLMGLNEYFLKAILIHLGVDSYEIQGDAVLTNHRIVSDWFREGEDYVINGFRYRTGTFEYVNGIKKLTSVELLNAKLYSGQKLWSFRRTVYRLSLIHI